MLASAIWRLEFYIIGEVNMMKFSNLKSSLIILAVAVVCFGLWADPVEAKSKNNRVEKVNCNKGQSVQKVLNKYLTDKKSLKIVIKGTCTNEPNGEVQIERDEVEFKGSETGGGGHIPVIVLVDEAREFVISDNMRIDNLVLTSAQAIIESEEGTILIDNDITLNDQSSLAMGTDGPSSITVNGDISINNDSLLTVQEEVSIGTVILNGEVTLELQSSLRMRNTSIGDLSIKYDSHVLFGMDVIPVSGSNEITCDSHSRAWNVPVGFNVGLDPNGISCEAN